MSDLSMEKFVIKGGRRLKGIVKISGSKNASLPILFATLLSDERCVIENVPNLKDISTAIQILEYLGKRICWEGSTVRIDTHGTAHNRIAPYELVKKMRASFLVSGALLSKYGYAKVALPGGCAIGVRPVDIHLSGFKKLGAKVKLEAGYVVLSGENISGYFQLPLVSVGATENLILATCLGDNKETIIDNIAIEPEVLDLIGFLNTAGANISFINKRTIKIIGVRKLKPLPYKIIPDRIETGTMLIATAITKGDITIKDCIPDHVHNVLRKIRSAGLKVSSDETVIHTLYTKKLKPVSIVTQPYPGFPSDLQAQWMALMCITPGKAVIEENIFENRFLHVPELQRLGATLQINNNQVVVTGVKKLTGAPVMVSDLRAGAALVLAALAAEGETVISHIYHLDRGYENLEYKLQKLGAQIKRIKA